MARAGDIAASQQRLRRLLRANREIAGELSRPAVLERVLEAARDLSGARQAAVAVLAGDGGVDTLVQVGMDEATAAALGQTVQGGTLPDDRGSFLQVPIQVQQETIGHLFLADARGGSWLADDEELLAAMAGTAGIAIESARLYEESGRRQAWLRASAEIAGVLHDPAGPPPLDHL